MPVIKAAMATGDFPESREAPPATSAPADASVVLARALAACCPPGVAFATARIASVTEPLLQGEEEAVRGVSSRRHQEYLAGRSCARVAMASLGARPLPILSAASREPIWPPGWVGSISHSATLCAALVGREARFAGIGLDIELDGPLEPEVARIVCSEKELQRAAALRGAGSAIDGDKLCFVVKEAFYKLYFPRVRERLDFPDVEVEVDPSTARFVARLSGRCAALNGQRGFDGRFGHAGGHAFALIVLPCATDPSLESGHVAA